MIRRSSRILLELVIGLVALAVILSGIAVWRLAQGPLQLNFLTRYLEQSIAGEETDLELSIGQTVLVWSAESRALDLRALAVRLRDASGRSVAVLPWVSVKLSLKALLRGVVAPQSIEIHGVRLSLYRDPTGGGFSFEPLVASDAAVTEPDPEPADVQDSDLSVMLPRLLAVLIAPASPDQPLGYLNVVRIRDGRLTLIGEAGFKDWRIPFQVVELRRDRLGLAGMVALQQAPDGLWAGLDLDFDYDRQRQVIGLTTRLNRLFPEVLTRLAPDLAALSGLRVPLSGRLSAELGATGLLRELEFELTGTSGRLELADLLPDSLPIEGLRLAGRWDLVDSQLEVSQFEVRFGADDGAGPVLSLEASMTGAPEGGRLSLRAAVSRLSAKDLPRYWPVGLASSGREWVVENVTAGAAEQAEVAAELLVPGGDLAGVEVLSVEGGYRYHGLTVHYYRPLPPVVGVSGSARFDNKSMVFTPDSGRLDELDVAGAEIGLLDLDTDAEQIEITLAGSGPLESLLRILDWETVRLVSALGLDPATIEGAVELRARIAFPLLVDLLVEQIEYQAEARMAQVSVGDLLFGWDLAQGDLALDLDNAAMEVTGRAELQGLPLEFRWRERLADEEGPRSIIEASAETATQANLKALGFDLGTYAEGPLSAVISARLFDQDRGALEASLDLTRTEITLPELHWGKAAGRRAEFQFATAFSGDGLVEVNDIDLSGDDFLLRGDARLDLDAGRLTWLNLGQVRFGANRLSGLQASIEGDSLALRVGGEVLDLAPYLASREGGETGDGPADGWTDLRLVANDLDRVILAEDHYLEHVSLELKRDSEGWQKIWLDGEVPRAFWLDQPAAVQPADSIDRPRQALNKTGIDTSLTPDPPAQEPDSATPGAAESKRHFLLDYRPDGAGAYGLDFSASDVGSLLRATDLSDSFIGGRARITGKSAGPLPASTLSGSIEIDDYTLINAPVLAKILTFASLTGLMDTLRGRGVHFEKLIGGYALTDGLLQSDLIRAYGPGLGLTTKGHVDFYEEELKLSGTVVPAYTVNAILGEIPGLGPLLIGGEGEGLLAITYDAEGPLDDPEVSVNALSALAPGFLRGLFDDLGGDGEPTVFPTERNK